MNKTAIGFLAGGVLVASLGAGLMVQHRQNAELARRLSKLDNELLAQTKTVAEQYALLESAAAILAEARQGAKQKENTSDPSGSPMARVRGQTAS